MPYFFLSMALKPKLSPDLLDMTSIPPIDIILRSVYYFPTHYLSIPSLAFHLMPQLWSSYVYYFLHVLCPLKTLKITYGDNAYLLCNIIMTTVCKATSILFLYKLNKWHNKTLGTFCALIKKGGTDLESLYETLHFLSISNTVTLTCIVATHLHLYKITTFFQMSSWIFLDFEDCLRGYVHNTLISKSFWAIQFIAFKGK